MKGHIDVYPPDALDPLSRLVASYEEVRIRRRADLPHVHGTLQVLKRLLREEGCDPVTITYHKRG